MLRRFIALFGLALSFLTASPAPAEVPDSIHIQGILTDTAGNPITVPVVVTFSVFDSESGGDERYSEQQEVTPDELGRFNAYLGAGHRELTSPPLTSGTFRHPSRWLEIDLPGQPPFPRVAFTTSPYSYRVQTIDGAVGGMVYGDLRVDSIPRYYSVSTADWYKDGDRNLTVFGRGQIELAGYNNWAPVHLPHGAILKRIVAYAEYLPLSSYLQLKRKTMLGTQFAEGLASSNVPFDGAVVDSIVLTGFSDPVIDNITYSYFLGLGCNLTSEIRLQGVRIEYVVTRPLP